VSARFSLPLVLDGGSVDALVVGGGSVATRKAVALANGGAHVRVRAPEVGDELIRRAAGDEQILIECAVYDATAIGEATLVVAATNDRTLNARVAADARRARRLVLVTGEPQVGNCVMPAVHRIGELLLAVTSGGVPGASRRVRDALARRFDDRYAAAVRELSRLRTRLLASEDRAAWRSAAAALLAEDFCESVESGEFNERLAAWQ
jgi:siroheme synthase-like protein